MKAELNTVEREVVVTTKVKEEVVTLTLTKAEFAIIQDALYDSSKQGHAMPNVKRRAHDLFVKTQGKDCNEWWYSQDLDKAFTEVK
jgi:PHD/YefM family antitoxin component YafN of YafNO toxin-antitoxin module